MERVTLPSTGERMARATFAAVLSAASGNCSCEACEILRTVAKEIKAEFLGGPKPP